MNAQIDAGRRAAALTLLLAVSCAGGDPPAPDSGEYRGQEATSAGARAVLLNEEGRDALGLVLEDVAVRATGPRLELPGAVEPTFDALQVAAAPMEGRVEVVALPLSSVEPGALLFRVDAPSWRSMQSELAAVEAELEGHAAWLDQVEGLERAHRRHEAALSALETRWTDRLAQLQAIRDAGGGQAAALVSAQASLLDARARLAEAQEVGARLAVDRAERLARRATAEARQRSLLARAATVTGVPVEELATAAEGEGRTWRSIERIEVRARRAGLVVALEITDGAWADAGDVVVRIRRPGAVHVRAAVFQADLDGLEDGASVLVRRGPEDAGVEGILRRGVTANARDRSAQVLVAFAGEGAPAWARPGTSVLVTVPAKGTSPARVAVPTSALRRLGADRVVWAENPAKPVELLAVTVEVVEEGSEWSFVEGPLEPGNRVVSRGAGRLGLAARGAGQVGGHFHADGTFHAEDH